MPTINLPSKHHIDFTYKTVYINADNTSVIRFCVENNISTGATYTKTDIPFSKDGGVLSQYYSATSGATFKAGWNVQFDYAPIVKDLTY